MASYLTNDTELTSIADAIREKGGTSLPLVYPNGFVAAIGNISGGGTDTSDATLTSGAQMLNGYTAYSNGVKYTGNILSRTASDLSFSGPTIIVPQGNYAQQESKTMNNGNYVLPMSQSATGVTVTQTGTTLKFSDLLTITSQSQAGYISTDAKQHQITINLSATDNNFLADNIRSGKTIFGLTGTYSGGGDSGIGTLLNTTSLGSRSITSTSNTSLSQSVVVADASLYDLIICEISVDTETKGRHCATVTFVALTSDSIEYGRGTVNLLAPSINFNYGSNDYHNSKMYSSTTKYGLFPYSPSISNGTLTMPIYGRYNSNYTNTINGNYTARVYGINLYDLIGG